PNHKQPSRAITQPVYDGPFIVCEAASFPGSKYILDSKDPLEMTKKYFYTEEKCLQNPKTAKEVKYLKQLISDISKLNLGTTNTETLGPVNIAEEMKKQTFSVNHYWEGITKKYMGFGPEDDPLFLHQHSDYFPKGSIKINFTERSFEFISLYFEMLKPDEKNQKAAKGALAFLTRVFAHESLHGWQLKTNPIEDFKRYPPETFLKELEDRNINPKVVEGTNFSIKYEKDASTMDRVLLIKFYDDLLALEKFFKENLEEISKKYPLLDESFLQYYISSYLEGGVSKDGEDGYVEGFPKLLRYTYLGQSATLQMLVEMIEINNDIAAGRKTAQECLGEILPKYEYVMELIYPDFRGRSDESIKQSIVSVENGLWGIKEIKAALYKEFDTFESYFESPVFEK
ncbi:MAG: hypothetical protein LBM71_01930, partial [Elusimicrobiota bacterium]|nr:hypothetical protein [Elusimicrobiota bacterium]